MSFSFLYFVLCSKTISFYSSSLYILTMPCYITLFACFSGVSITASFLPAASVPSNEVLGFIFTQPPVVGHLEL